MSQLFRESGKAATCLCTANDEPSTLSNSTSSETLQRAITLRRPPQGQASMIDAAPLREATEWMERYRRFWEGSFDRLDDYLEEMKRNVKKPERER